MIPWTAEELAEMAAADAEIEESFEETPEETAKAEEWDDIAIAERMGKTREQREQEREVWRRYYKKNRETILEKKKAYRAEHLMECKERQRRWYRENREEIVARRKARQAERKEHQK